MANLPKSRPYTKLSKNARRELMLEPTRTLIVTRVERMLIATLLTNSLRQKIWL